MLRISSYNIINTIILEISNKNIKEELDLWCNYSNMLSPMAYVECEDCGELKSVCECIHEKINNK